MPEVKLRQMERICSTKNRATLNETVREALGIALLQLMETKPIQTITVSEMAEVAGVSRSSFYRNFESREALLQDYIASLYRASFHEGRGRQQDSATMREFLVSHFRFIKEHSQIYRTLYQQKLLYYFFRQFEDALVRRLYGEDNELTAFHRAMLSSACAGMIRCWIEHDFKESEELMATMFLECSCITVAAKNNT